MSQLKLIAGSGRSGTTWVLDALAEANRLRPVFEPLHPHASKIGQTYAHRVLAPDAFHPELQEFFKDIAAGHRVRLWTRYRCQASWLLPRKTELSTIKGAARLGRRWGKFLKEMPGLALMTSNADPLIKCIWSNLMLGWITQQCNGRVVLLVRHPGAVIESELRSDWNANFVLDRFRRDSMLHVLTAGRYQELLDRSLSPLEALAARWLIENQWVIEHAPANGVTVVSYERLRSSPEITWEQIRVALDLRLAPDSSILAKPSQQSAREKSDAFGGAMGQPRWQRVLTSDQKGQIQRVLDQASCDLYSMSDAEPRNDANRFAVARPAEVAR